MVRVCQEFHLSDNKIIEFDYLQLGQSGMF